MSARRRVTDKLMRFPASPGDAPGASIPTLGLSGFGWVAKVGDISRRLRDKFPNSIQSVQTKESAEIGRFLIVTATHNRVREVCDLLFNPDQTGQLIDEYAAIINDPAGGLSMVDADRCMWDYHWVVGNGAYPKYIDQSPSFKAGQGRFYRKAAQSGYEQSFEGMIQVMKDYIVELSAAKE